MKIIISPAKKMNVHTDSMQAIQKPIFLEEARYLMHLLQKADRATLCDIWKVNESILDLNIERLADMDLDAALTPAILSYEGLQYQAMAAHVFDEEMFAYIEKHLRILSGFYGILTPFTGITPYRLEMQARISIGEVTDLYAFWGDKIYKALFQEERIVLNLASKEYAKAIKPYLQKEDCLIDINFYEKVGEKLVQKGTYAKQARGEMVRLMAKDKIESLEDIKKLKVLGYGFSEKDSGSREYTFIR